jgi:hypothetical protein
MEVEHDGTAQSIVDSTQKKWIRPAGKELWHIEDRLTPSQKKAVMDYCNKIGLFDEVRPLYLDYDYAVVFGATASRIEKRIAFLSHLSDTGTSFKKVVLLSSGRPLDLAVEMMPAGCKTEGEVMAYLWKAHSLSQKVAWEQFDHPMITPQKRPTTGDTIRLWLASSPTPGRCIMISNQPYCLYQQLVTQNVMPKSFTFETVGSAADLTALNPQAALDTIARCLYEANKGYQGS